MSATMEERVAALEARVAEQDAHRQYRSCAERDLIKAALQWARLTAMGFYTNTGPDGRLQHIMMNKTDAADMATYQLSAIQRAAMALLRIEASGGDP